MSVQRFWRLVAACIVLRLAASGIAFMQAWQSEFGRPLLEGNFLFLDEAIGLAGGHLTEFSRSLGFPSLLAAAGALAGARTPDALWKTALWINGVVCVIASIVLVAWLMLRLTKRPAASLAVTILWCALPWLMSLVVRVAPSYDYPELRWSRLLGHLWFQVLTEPSAVVFVLLGVSLVLASFHPRRHWLSLFSGVAFGVATWMRPPVLPTASVGGALLTQPNGWSRLAMFACGLLAGLSPQLWINWRIFGRPWISGEWIQETGEAAETAYAFGVFSWQNLAVAWHDVFGLFPAWLLALAGLAAGVMGAGLAQLWKADRTAGLLVALWVVPYGLFVSTYWGVQWAIARYALPVAPALLLGLVLGWQRWRPCPRS